MGLALSGACSLMTLVWVWQLKTGNAGVVDVAWGTGIGLVGVFLAATSPGDFSRRVLLALLVAVWAIRLSTYLFLRVVGHPEEGRYASLRAAWGAQANTRLFWFFQMQAATVVLFALPIWLAAYNVYPLGEITDYVGMIVWLVGVGGVALSDWQLAQFKRQPSSRGRTCRQGLWKYSRHPNYFFEWLLWWSYTFLAYPTWAWWLAPVTPLLLLYFFLYVTGIPPTEAQALATRGDDYRDYQRTTSPFFPWPPKS